ncbi:MAG: gamma subclass chorismate mutase AroQ [Pseudomonadota bacterium]
MPDPRPSKGTLAIVLQLAIVTVALPLADATADDRDAAAVYATIEDRLLLMKPVAAWKRAHDAPVADLAREAVVLDRAVADAAAAGLDGESARPLFAAQIEAAKDIQHCWLDRWNHGVTVPDRAPDLVDEIRPQLLAVGATLLQSIEAALAAGTTFGDSEHQAFTAEIDVDCLSTAARDEVFQGLQQVRLAD